MGRGSGVFGHRHHAPRGHHEKTAKSARLWTATTAAPHASITPKIVKTRFRDARRRCAAQSLRHASSPGWEPASAERPRPRPPCTRIVSSRRTPSAIGATCWPCGPVSRCAFSLNVAFAGPQIVDHERERAHKKAATATAASRRVRHGPDLAPEDHARRDDQTGERPHKQSLVPQRQAEAEKPRPPDRQFWDGPSQNRNSKITPTNQQNVFQRDWTPVECVRQEKDRIGGQQQRAESRGEGRSRTSGARESNDRK